MRRGARPPPSRPPGLIHFPAARERKFSKIREHDSRFFSLCRGPLARRLHAARVPLVSRSACLFFSLFVGFRCIRAAPARPATAAAAAPTHAFNSPHAAPAPALAAPPRPAGRGALPRPGAATPRARALASSGGPCRARVGFVSPSHSPTPCRALYALPCFVGCRGIRSRAPAPPPPGRPPARGRLKRRAPRRARSTPPPSARRAADKQEPGQRPPQEKQEPGQPPARHAARWLRRSGGRVAAGCGARPGRRALRPGGAAAPSAPPLAGGPPGGGLSRFLLGGGVGPVPAAARPAHGGRGGAAGGAPAARWRGGGPAGGARAHRGAGGRAAEPVRVAGPAALVLAGPGPAVVGASTVRPGLGVPGRAPPPVRRVPKGGGGTPYCVNVG